MELENDLCFPSVFRGLNIKERNLRASSIARFMLFRKSGNPSHETSYPDYILIYLLFRNGTALSAKDSGRLSNKENSQIPTKGNNVRLFVESRVEKGV